MEKKTSEKSRELIRLGIGIGVLLIGVIIAIIYLSWPLLNGTTIILDTMPVDPFDPFRGQYIIINYEVNNLEPLNGAVEGDTIYVSLDEDEESIWRPEEISLIKPDTGIFLKGKLVKMGRSMRVEYGIEQYFFERDASLPNRNMTVEVKVDGSGQARIVQLLYNGEPMEMLYQDVTLTS